MHFQLQSKSSDNAGAARGRTRRGATAIASTLLLALGACQDGSTPTQAEAPGELIDQKQPVYAVADPTRAAGYIQICKVRGDGINANESFQFALSGTNVAALTTTVLAGGCSDAIATNVGNVTVTETQQSGVFVDQITFVGPGAGASSFNLGSRVATVNVVESASPNNPSRVTIVNFRNRRGEGFVKVCKIGVADGTATTLGQTFSFVFGGAARVGGGIAESGFPLIAAAGTEASSNCDIIGGSQTPTLYAAGSVVTVTEGESATSTLDAITYSGEGSVSRSGRIASVTIGSGENIVRFRNIPVRYPLEICKVGVGIPAGTNFSFSAGGATYTAASGTVTAPGCVVDGSYPAGTVVTVTENAFPTIPGLSIALTGVAPGGPASVGGTNLVARTTQVTIGATTATSGANRVIFTNTGTATQVPATLQVCKTGVGGIITGSPFTFSVTFANTAAQTVTALANGACATIPGRFQGDVATVVENAVANTSLTGIVISPPATGTVNPGTRTAVVTLAAGTNTVTFTNVATAIVELCKIAGNAGAVGQSFSFTSNIITGSVTRTATAAGNCAQLGGPVAVGSTVTVTEASRLGYIVFGNVYTMTRTIVAGTNTITFRNFAALRLCTFTQGYYKNHGPNANGNQSDILTPLLLFGQLTGSPYVTATGTPRLIVRNQSGGVDLLTPAQIEDNLRTPPKGNQFLAFQHQLIAAQLNVLAIGVSATPQSVLNAIASGTNTDLLASFNEGRVGPGHCDD
ncbi:MAG TPA: hypothetical protein VE869_04970 [Gemmatimonas sp.]|nr:hypothetical protein [Gemmatimonas sp.]